MTTRIRDEDDDAANKRSKWDIIPPEGTVAPPPPAVAPGTTIVPVASTFLQYPSLIDGPALDGTGRMLEFSDADVSFKLQLHHDVIAALLGADGAVITAIRERTGCRMQFLNINGGPKMPIYFGGTMEAAHAAIGLVLAEMQNSCCSNPNVCSIENFKGENVPTYGIQVRRGGGWDGRDAMQGGGVQGCWVRACDWHAAVRTGV